MNKLIQRLQQENENVKAQVRPERPCSEGSSLADPPSSLVMWGSCTLPGSAGEEGTYLSCLTQEVTALTKKELTNRRRSSLGNSEVPNRDQATYCQR